MKEKLTLEEKIARARDNGKAIRHVVETTVEDYLAMENAIALLEVVVPFAQGKVIHREERGLHLPCLATQINYTNSAFKSRTRETIGELTEGCSIDIYGFDIQRDGEGKPLTQTIGEGEEAHEVLMLIDKDEQDQPLEPKFLMSFRPQWGIDRSKQYFNRLRNQDMLNLVPNRGVPRKTPTTAATEGETSEKKTNYEVIAWDLLSGLQPAIEKPILNAKEENNEAMLEWIECIPVAPNAPSTQAANQAGISGPISGGQKAASVVADLEEDAFAKGPAK